MTLSLSHSRSLGISHLKPIINTSLDIFLVYGVEVVVLIIVMVPPARLALISKLANPHDQIYDMEALEERGQKSK